MAGPGTTFTGPVMSGTQRFATQTLVVNLGVVVLTQQATVTFAAGATATASVAIPADSQILEILADTTVLWNTGGTTPAAALTVGITAGGTDYLSGVSVLAAGRAAPTYTAAELIAMQNVGTNITVYVTVTQSAASGLINATTGSTTVTLVYAQKVELNVGST